MTDHFEFHSSLLQTDKTMFTSIIQRLFGKYRFYWLLWTISLAPAFISAQYRSDIQQKIDLLPRTLPVTIRIDYLNEISDYLFLAYEDDLSLYYAEEAHRLAGKSKYAKGLAEAHYNLAQLKRVSDHYDESLEWYTLALKAFEEMEAEHWLAKTHLGMSKLYWSMKQTELAKEYIQKAVTFFLADCESNPDSICMDAFNWQGYFQVAEQDYAAAINTFRLAIRYGIQSGCKTGLYYPYIHIGYNESCQGNYESGIDAYLKAINLYESNLNEQKSWVGEVKKAYYMVGINYVRLGNRLEALKYFEKAENLCPEDCALGGQNSLFLDMAYAYMRLDKHGEAQSYINRALAAAKKRSDDMALARGHQLMGGLFRNLEYNELAIEQYQIAASLYEETNICKWYSVMNMGFAQLELNQKEQAINSFKQAQLFGSQWGFGDLIRGPLSGRLKAGDTSVTYQQLIDLCLIELKNSFLDPQVIPLINESLMEGYYATQDFASAENYAYKLLSDAIKLNELDFKLNAYKYLADISHKLDKSALAFEFANKAYHLKDTIQEKKNRRVISEIQFRNKSELQKEEIEKLNQERENTNLTLKIQEESLHNMFLKQEKAHFRNLYQQQQLDLMANQQELSQCEVENNQAHIQVQEGQMRQKEDQLRLMDKESEVQQLAFHKQKVMKNISYSGLGVFALLFLLVRRNYITSQKLKLHLVRNKIAADLHDEVGGTLSSIQLFSEIAKQQSREVIPMLDTISDSAKKMLDAMTDIVWTINPENDDVEKILDRMRSFAFELMSAKGIEFEFNTDEDLHELRLPMEVKRSLYLIFKESTNNLVKYANASRVHFSIKEENRNLTMMIQDNGQGFDTGQTSKGNGLNNMRKRAKEIGGNLHIESKQNEGTTITLQLAV